MKLRILFSGSQVTSLCVCVCVCVCARRCVRLGFGSQRTVSSHCCPSLGSVDLSSSVLLSRVSGKHVSCSRNQTASSVLPNAAAMTGAGSRPGLAVSFH